MGWERYPGTGLMTLMQMQVWREKQEHKGRRSRRHHRKHTRHKHKETEMKGQSKPMQIFRVKFNLCDTWRH